MKKALALVCLVSVITQGSFRMSPKGFIEDKATGMRIMFYELKADKATVTKNDGTMKNPVVRNGDKIVLVLSGVNGFIPKAGSPNVFPACEVTITDENNNVLVESENILADA